MKVQKQQENTFRDTISTVLGIPVKIVLASSILILNAFAARAQQQQLRKIILEARDPQNADSEAKQELFNFYEYFKSTNSVLCPIMVKEYNAQEEQKQYKTGLLINGNYEWIQALGAIRDHLKIEPELSISFFCQGQLIGSGNVLIFHSKFKSQDGILYLQYMKLQSYG